MISLLVIGLLKMSEIREFFTPKEAAEFLRYSAATLAIWRSRGEGPAYVKIGHSVRYLRDDLKLWATGGELVRRRIEKEADCHIASGAKAKRARGRAGAEQRRRRLAAEPNCRDCAAEGVQRPAAEIDHIVPISMGGTDTDDNVRALCRPCHAVRSSDVATGKFREQGGA